MIIDDVMPSPDVTIAAHEIVAADLATTFAAASGLDFLSVRTPLLDAAMWVRGLPERITGGAPAVPPRLVLGEEPGLPGWCVLGRRTDTELAFGAVGRFWTPHIEWRDTPPAEFADFHEPGWGKIAADFSVRPYGPAHTLLSYECRTETTDAASRRRFARYWQVVRPFVGHIMRATVRTIRDHAERDQATGATASVRSAVGL
jgi:hypothetical protein